MKSKTNKRNLNHVYNQVDMLLAQCKKEDDYEVLSYIIKSCHMRYVRKYIEERHNNSLLFSPLMNLNFKFIKFMFENIQIEALKCSAIEDFHEYIRIEMISENRNRCTEETRVFRKEVFNFVANIDKEILINALKLKNISDRTWNQGVADEILRLSK